MSFDKYSAAFKQFFNSWILYYTLSGLSFCVRVWSLIKIDASVFIILLRRFKLLTLWMKFYIQNRETRRNLNWAATFILLYKLERKCTFNVRVLHSTFLWNWIYLKDWIFNWKHQSIRHLNFKSAHSLKPWQIKYTLLILSLDSQSKQPFETTTHNH